MSDIYLPNMGRARLLEPPNVDHLFRDPDRQTDVSLTVWDTNPGSTIPPGDRHWAIVWKVGLSEGKDVCRLLQVTREIDDEGVLMPHLTSWGPVTKILGRKTIGTASFYCLATMSLEQRKWLERVSEMEPVLRPNGWWNCQDWIVSIFSKCVNGGLLNKETVQSILVDAGKNVAL